MAVEPWAGILGYQTLVVHGLIHHLLLKAASHCQDEPSFKRLLNDYRELKEALGRRIESGARPGSIAGALVEVISRRIPSLARPAAYFGYGLWNNFGLRKPFRVFADRWIFPIKHNGRKNPRTIRIHLDGEVYMRTSQAEAVLNLLIDHLGIGAFEMTMTPTWVRPVLTVSLPPFSVCRGTSPK